jgi:D-alanyl-D-alanine carboxypeptidase (penicillin-binding protein 5/6)
MQLKDHIIAPIAQDQPLGRVVVRLADESVVEEDLVALNPVPEGSFLQRLVDEALLYFE